MPCICLAVEKYAQTISGIMKSSYAKYFWKGFSSDKISVGEFYFFFYKILHITKRTLECISLVNWKFFRGLSLIKRKSRRVSCQKYMKWTVWSYPCLVMYTVRQSGLKPVTFLWYIYYKKSYRTVPDFILPIQFAFTYIIHQILSDLWQICRSFLNYLRSTRSSAL